MLWDTNPEKTRAIFEELELAQVQSDRAFAILLHTWVDELILTGLKAFLSPAKSPVDSLFALNRPLQPYAARVHLARCLSIIDDREYANLRLLGKIRNHFGHHIVGVNLRPLRFDEEPIAGWCREFTYSPSVVNFSKSTQEHYAMLNDPKDRYLQAALQAGSPFDQMAYDKVTIEDLIRKYPIPLPFGHAVRYSSS